MKQFVVVALLVLAACSGTQLTGKAISGCLNGSQVSRLCDGEACQSNSSDFGCCPDGVNYCVWQGSCYKVNLLWAQKPGYYPKGMFCFRLLKGFQTTELARWYDCDSAEGAYCSNKSYCGYKAAVSGEEGVGEYNYLGKRECCGDDKNEFYIIGNDSTAVCCASPLRMVEQAKCIPIHTAAPNMTEPSKPNPSQSLTPTTSVGRQAGNATNIIEPQKSLSNRGELRVPLFHKFLLWLKALF